MSKSEVTLDDDLPFEEKDRFCISDEDVLSLARWSIIIEDHYKKSMDCELCLHFGAGFKIKILVFDL